MVVTKGRNVFTPLVEPPKTVIMTIALRKELRVRISLIGNG